MNINVIENDNRVSKTSKNGITQFFEKLTTLAVLAIGQTCDLAIFLKCYQNKAIYVYFYTKEQNWKLFRKFNHIHEDLSEKIGLKAHNGRCLDSFIFI